MATKTPKSKPRAKTARKAPAAARRSARSDSEFADAVKDSAHQIWLAGLGAFAKAQDTSGAVIDKGNQLFDTLVRQGTSIQKRTMKVTEDKVNEVTSKVTKAATRLSDRANGTWDKLEGVFEQRVERALARLGVPTAKEVADLAKRVEQLTASVQALTKSPKPAAPAKAAKKAVRKAAKPAAPVKAAKKVAKKAVRKSAKPAAAPVAAATPEAPAA